jgi:DNA-binding response OmpR family regulator
MPARILVVDDSSTIRKVVTGILERNGYDVLAAADGQAALEALNGDTQENVDLVLLDFVMPKMNGYQFCRAIRQSDTLAALPIVLMSAKSDKIRDQFVQQTGAIDALSKPFDAQALVATIENALRRINSGRASAARLPEIDEEEPADSGETTSPGEERMRRARIAAEVSVRVANAIAPALARVTQADAGDPDQIARALMDHLAPEALHGLVGALSELDADDPQKPSLGGDLAVVPIGAALQLLQVEGQSGVLLVSTRSKNVTQEIAITLRGGLIDLVQSRGTTDEFRLGRYFVEEGLVTPQEIERILVNAGPPANDGSPPASGNFDVPPEAASEPATLRILPDQAQALLRNMQASEEPLETTSPEGIPAAAVVPRLLGDRLVAAGRVNEEQLRAALVRQSSELVYEILRWQKGRFAFRRRPPTALAAAAKLGLTVPAVVMEGFRRVDEWRKLEGTIGSFEGVLVRDALAIDAVPKDKLAKPERMVLDAIDGERTIREVVAACHMSSFDACRVIVELLEARLVRRLIRLGST